MPYTKTTWKDRAVQYPNKYTKSGETSTEVTLVSNPGTVTEAGTPLNATNLNNIEKQYDAAMTDTEQRDYKVYKSNKDSNDVFTTVQYKRNDGTLAIQSILSGGTSPQYTTRTITYYAADGTTVQKTTTRTLSYDAGGVLVSEV